MKGKVYLVGAGPGDPELLTVKAAKRAIITAVLVYVDWDYTRAAAILHVHPTSLLKMMRIFRVKR